jgi:hypothetical protein
MFNHYMSWICVVAVLYFQQSWTLIIICVHNSQYHFVQKQKVVVKEGKLRIVIFYCNNTFIDSIPSHFLPDSFSHTKRVGLMTKYVVKVIVVKKYKYLLKDAVTMGVCKLNVTNIKYKWSGFLVHFLCLYVALIVVHSSYLYCKITVCISACLAIFKYTSWSYNVGLTR